MSYAMMRSLDRRLGAWLCRMLAWLPRRAKTPPASGSRVLCIGLAEMGSIVLAAPALQRLGGSAEIFFLTFAGQRDVPVVAAITGPGQVRVLRNGNIFRFCIDVAKFVFWARAMKFRAVIDLEPCMYFSALLAAASGASERAGFAHDGSAWKSRNALYTRALPYRGDRHMADSFAALARMAIAEAGAESLSARVTPLRGMAPRTAAVSADSRLVLLNPNAGDAIPQRRWPAERFIELARRLLASVPDLHIALIGSAADAPACAHMAAQLPAARCANLAGHYAIGELPALFSRARLLISNDSGPAHLASLAGLPSVVLFGPETPTLYRPLGKTIPIYAAASCSPCITPDNHRATDCRDNRCMKAIGVEQVLAVVEGLLAARAASSTDRTGRLAAAC